MNILGAFAHSAAEVVSRPGDPQAVAVVPRDGLARVKAVMAAARIDGDCAMARGAVPRLAVAAFQASVAPHHVQRWLGRAALRTDAHLRPNIGSGRVRVSREYVGLIAASRQAIAAGGRTARRKIAATIFGLPRQKRIGILGDSAWTRTHEMDCSKEADRGIHGPVEWRLHQLRMSIEMGYCRNIRKAIDLWGTTLEAAENQMRQAEYAWLLNKIERMFSIERVHGGGSLLELGHPYVVALNSTPKSSFGVEELKAAKKYRSAMGEASDRLPLPFL